MKRILLRSLTVLLLAITADNTFAATVLESMSFNPYIGVDYQYEHIKANGDWVQILPANFQNKAFFIGNRYHKHFGIELGYYSTLKTSANSATFDSFDGKSVSAQTVAFANIKSKGFSVEWNVFVPLDPNFEIFSVAGLVTIHPTIKITSNSNSNLATAFRKISGANKTILRLGFGVEYFEKSWGARGKILWDHTQHLYINTNGASSNFSTVSKKAFKQACVVVVGLFYKF